MTDTLFAPQEGEQQQASTAAPQEQQTPQGQESNTTQPTTDPSTLFANQLAAIKADDGRQKYADVNAALGSIPHAQTHISQLESQVAQLQEEVNKRQGMEQVLERIESTKQTNTEQPSVNSLGEADVLSLVDAALVQREQTSRAYANEVEVTNALVSKFGDKEKAVQQLQNKATELGVDVAFLQGMSQHSPKAVLQYFDAVPKASPNPTTPGFNTAILDQNVPAEGDPRVAATRKLMGQDSALLNNWRAAAPKQN